MVLFATAVAPFAAVMTAFRQEPAHLLARQATTDAASIYTVCSNQIQSCIPTVRSCATSLCSRCTSIGATAIDFCCGESNQASCFSSVLADELSTTLDSVTATSAASSFTAGGGGGGITTPPAACSSLTSVINSCSRADANFNNAGSSEVASCLCYNTRSSFIGTQIDGYIDTCVAYLSTAEPDLYSTATILEGFCEAVGDIRGSGSDASSATTTTTRAATTRSTASAGSGAGATAPVSTNSPNAAFRVDALVSSNPVASLILAATLFLTLA